jgi:hypothetical protein
MRRVVNVMQVAFWTSVPAFAVYLAVTSRDGRLGWPGVALGFVVMASSAFLTARASLLMPPREEGGELPETGGVRSHRCASEWLAYPVVLFFAAYLFGSQGLYY